MRNELEVSFFLFIGLASGYLVPPGITELTEKNIAKSLNKINEATTDLTSFSYANEKKKSFTMDLQHARNTIHDSEILSQGVQRPNNINSRSYIFIRQKYRNPMLTLFHSQIQNPLATAQDAPKAQRIKVDTDKFEELSRRFSPLNTINTGKDYSGNYVSKVLDKTQDGPMNQACNTGSKSENDVTTKKASDAEPPQDVDKNGNEQRDYVELLKTPLLRSNHVTEKTVLKESERQTFEVSRAPLNSRNNEKISKMSIDLNLVKKYNREYRPYKSKYTFYTNDVARRHDDQDIYSNFKSNFSSKIFEESKDKQNKKRVDKYSESIYEAKTQDIKRPGHRHHFCNECPKKNLKYDVYHRSRLYPDCKCGRHVYLNERPGWNNQVKLVKQINDKVSDLKQTGHKDDGATMIPRTKK